MDAVEAFTALVNRGLETQKARRYAALAPSKKGQQKILSGLYHDFEHAIRPEAVRSPSNPFWDLPCYAYSQTIGFGHAFSTLREAFEQLCRDDSWLIILQDGSAGIHRPEGRWDAQKVIAPGFPRK